MSEDEPMDDLKSSILASVQAQPAAPSRGELRRHRIKTTAIAVVVSLTVFFIAGGVRRTDRPIALVLETAITAAVVAILVSIVALWRGRSMLGASPVVRIGAAIATPFALLIGKLAITSGFEGMDAEFPDREGFKCLNLSLFIGVALLVAFVIARRRSAPLRPALTGTALGAAAGAWSWVLVDLWCPVAEIPHLLLGHVLPVVALALVGTWLGGRLLDLVRRR